MLVAFQVWEKLQADLKTNGDGIAVWKDNYLLTESGKKLSTNTLKNVSIK